MSRKVDPDDERFAGEILWPDSHDTLAGPRVARADVDSRKGGAIRNGRPYRRGLQEESDASSLPHHPPLWKGTDSSVPTESSLRAYQNYADSRLSAVAVAGIGAETAAGDLEIGQMFKSTGAKSGMLPVSLSHAPYDPRVGAVHEGGLAVEAGGDYDTVDIGDETVITESPEAVVAKEVTQDTWTSELRAQLQSEIQEETQAQLRRQSVAAVAVAILGSDEGAPRPFWTRKRVYLAALIVMVAVLGIVMGVLFATGTLGDDGIGGPTVVQRLGGQDIRDEFGTFVVLSRDGSTLAVGANKKQDYAKVFRWNSTYWNQIGKTITVGHGEFGGNVDLNQDGSTLLVGAKYGNKTGLAQVWQYIDSEWNQIGEFKGDRIDDRFGSYVSLSSDGRTVALSVPYGDTEKGNDTGYVRVFTYGGSPYQWFQLGPDLVGENAKDQFGCSIALAADGLRLAVGAVDWEGRKGRVQVFEYSGGNWTPVGQPLDGVAAEDFQGVSVDLSANGSIVAVGAHGNDLKGEKAGLVRVYTLDKGGQLWAQLGQNLTGEAIKSEFGASHISLSDNGDCLAVGAYAYDSFHGRGYLFQWRNLQWNKIASVTGESNDRLGDSATVSGNCTWYAFGSPSPNSYGHVDIYRVA